MFRRLIQNCSFRGKRERERWRVNEIDEERERESKKEDKTCLMASHQRMKYIHGQMASEDDV